MSLAEEFGFDFSKESCEALPFSRYPCRKCLPCLLARQKAWVSRLVEELSQHEDNYFVTLTYDDDHLPVDENGQYMVSRDHIKKLNRDIRKRFQDGRFRNPFHDLIYDSPEFIELPQGVSYKYYITSEYGPSESGTHRPHYHSVFYGMQIGIYDFELLLKLVWPYGFVQVYPARPGATGYISSYLVCDSVGVKSYIDDTRVSPFSIMSKGLGLSYAERMGDWHRQDPSRMYKQDHGQKSRLDRYLKHKIYSDDVMSEYSEKMTKKHGEQIGRYQKFKQEHPMLYHRLLQERNKYFQDMAESIKWKVNLKHSIQ